jgi:hypothetical protein
MIEVLARPQHDQRAQARRGRVEMIVSGWTKLSYSTPRMMYTATSAARISHGWLASELWNAWAAPWKLPLWSACRSRLAWIEHDHRIAQRHAGRQVERQVGGREHAVMADRQGPMVGGSTLASADSGTISPVSGERR